MPKRKKQQVVQTIHITVDANGDLIYKDASGNDASRYKMKAGESVQWVYSGGPFTVDFTLLSPFDYSKFHGNSGSTVEKARVRPDRPIGRYEYFVALQRTVAGSPTILTDDPDIIIWRPKK